jgi:hypothetical protein
LGKSLPFAFRNKKQHPNAIFALPFTTFIVELALAVLQTVGHQNAALKAPTFRELKLAADFGPKLR